MQALSREPFHIPNLSFPFAVAFCCQKRDPTSENRKVYLNGKILPKPRHIDPYNHTLGKLLARQYFQIQIQ